MSTGAGTMITCYVTITNTIKAIDPDTGVATGSSVVSVTECTGTCGRSARRVVPGLRDRHADPELAGHPGLPVQRRWLRRRQRPRMPCPGHQQLRRSGSADARPGKRRPVRRFRSGHYRLQPISSHRHGRDHHAVQRLQLRRGPRGLQLYRQRHDHSLVHSDRRSVQRLKLRRWVMAQLLGQPDRQHRE